ncbi:MAG TPA: ATP-binding cassette domain-containing protein, partial [Candidatus Limnocylindria bacterium]|nr:ATP-binding cassette domain-containing protein [Candidatus Limnocylindria bacterium]
MTTEAATTSAGASNGAMLTLKAVHTNYGRIRALQGIDLEVGRGEIVTLIGANGAGKTTTLKTVSGVRHVTSGSVVFDGKDITT